MKTSAGKRKHKLIEQPYLSEKKYKFEKPKIPILDSAKENKLSEKVQIILQSNKDCVKELLQQIDSLDKPKEEDDPIEKSFNELFGVGAQESKESKHKTDKKEPEIVEHKVIIEQIKEIEKGLVNIFEESKELFSNNK